MNDTILSWGLVGVFLFAIWLYYRMGGGGPKK